MVIGGREVYLNTKRFSGPWTRLKDGALYDFGIIGGEIYGLFYYSRVYLKLKLYSFPGTL